MDLIAARECHYQEYRVFEADMRGREYCREELECLTDPLAAHKGWQRMRDVGELRCRYDAEQGEEACEYAGFVLCAKPAQEKTDLLRGLATVPRRAIRRADVRSVQLANAVVRQHGPRANCMRPRPVIQKAQCKIQPQPVAAVTII